MYFKKGIWLIGINNVTQLKVERDLLILIAHLVSGVQQIWQSTRSDTHYIQNYYR